MDSGKYEASVTSLIQKLKISEYDVVRIHSATEDGVYITPITIGCENSDFAEKLTKWRIGAKHAFPRIHHFTNTTTLRWMRSALMSRKDRLLFMVIDKYGKEIGHIGVSNINFVNRSCYLDNVIRGEISEQSNVMYSASLAIFEWIKKDLKVEQVKLNVFNDLAQALALYKKLGFRVSALIPMAKHKEKDVTDWVKANKSDKIDRIFLEMSLTSKEIGSNHLM